LHAALRQARPIEGFLIFSLFLLRKEIKKRKWFQAVPVVPETPQCHLESAMLKSFGYKLPGYFMEYGPVYAHTEDEARTLIRQRLNAKRLPWGLQVWDLERRPLAKWRVAQAS
jgi:hypothetical protein